MRAAAEVLADLEPEPGNNRLAAAALPKALKAATGAERKSLLHEAVREVVRTEVARERAAIEHSSPGRGVNAGRADSAGDGNSSASGQAHSAAALAQQAKRSNEVSLQHRQNFINSSQGTAPGQGHPPGLSPHPKP